MHKTTSKRWPEGAIVYHIYPRSFQDTNGDGIGDLPGVTSRLDYLNSLSVTAIWLSPFYPSPMADFGYDISDYCDVDPIFGTLDDFRTLLAEAKNHDIKVMIDLVPNHTSSEHEWFKASRESTDNPKADWYIWRDAVGKDKKGRLLPPNNWRDALTGGSAWQWDDKRQQFYLHSFDPRQPDLNWANPEVREAFKNIMRFWLDLGVDGFRVDAVSYIAKEPTLQDDELNPDFVEGEHAHYMALKHNNSKSWPPLYTYLSELAGVLKEEQYQNKHRFMVTEAYPENQDSLFSYMMYYVGVDSEVAAPFNFEGTGLPWEAAPWRSFFKRFHAALTQFSPLCVQSNAFGNHDLPRLVTRQGVERSRSVAVMLMTLPGMAFIYYGEELGMENGLIPPELVQDPAEKGSRKGGTGRDPERTPMQWSADKHAGFSTAAKTWLPVADNYPTRNVETESEAPDSFLSLYRTLGTLRSTSHALRYGTFTVLESGNEDVLTFERSYGHEKRYVTCVNFSDKEAECQLPGGVEKLIVSSLARTELDISPKHMITLDPFEAVILELEELKQ
jgi:alpha-glucosidase